MTSRRISTYGVTLPSAMRRTMSSTVCVTVATEPDEGGGVTQVMQAARFRVVHDNLIVENNEGKSVPWPRTKGCSIER